MKMCSQEQAIAMSKMVIDIFKNHLEELSCVSEKKLNTLKKAFVEASFINNNIEYCLAFAFNKLSISSPTFEITGKKVTISPSNHAIALANRYITNYLSLGVDLNTAIPTELYIDSPTKNIFEI